MTRALLIVLWFVASCALTSKAPPLDIRYYAPEVPAGATTRAAAPRAVRLGDVWSAAHLRSRIAFRESRNEIQFYDERRWAEAPDAYVRRALEHELVRRGALVTRGPAPKLEVEVLAFEQVRVPTPAARVVLHYTLTTERRVVRDGVIESVRPAGAGFASFVDAIGAAIADACARIIQEVSSVERSA